MREAVADAESYGDPPKLTKRRREVVPTVVRKRLV